MDCADVWLLSQIPSIRPSVLRLSLPSGHHTFRARQGKALEKDLCHLPRTGPHHLTAFTLPPQPCRAASISASLPAASHPRVPLASGQGLENLYGAVSSLAAPVSGNSGGGQSPGPLSQPLPSLEDSGVAPLLLSPRFQDRPRFYSFLSILRIVACFFHLYRLNNSQNRPVRPGRRPVSGHMNDFCECIPGHPTLYLYISSCI